MKSQNYKNSDPFNMLIVGTGGQGQITLLKILAEAVLIEGYDFKSSELHGLSQREGSVEVHLRFGKKAYSPLIPQGKVNLILGLEMQETLTAARFASLKTEFLINKLFVSIPGAKKITENQILKDLNKISDKINLIPAEKICQEKIGNSVVAGVYLISFSAVKNLIPLRSDSILRAIKKVVPKKYLDLNVKAFNLALDS